MMHIEHISIHGSSEWNEDAVVVMKEQNIFGVIDGATSLVPFRGENGETGGYLASRLIAGEMERLFSDPRNEPSLAEALVEANRQLRLKMEAEGIDASRNEQLWGAGAVMIRVHEHRIEFAQAGDCMLAAYYTNGSIRIATRDQLAHVDRETFRLWAEGVALGLQSREALWAHVYPQIVRGRQSANTSDGYGVLNGSADFPNHLEWGVINRLHMEELLLFTDGLYVPKTAAESPFDAEEVFCLVRKMGMQNYADMIVRMEESDPDCLLFPRVKKSDDKSAIRLKFVP